MIITLLLVYCRLCQSQANNFFASLTNSPPRTCAQQNTTYHTGLTKSQVRNKITLTIKLLYYIHVHILKYRLHVSHAQMRPDASLVYDDTPLWQGRQNFICDIPTIGHEFGLFGIQLLHNKKLKQTKNTFTRDGVEKWVLNTAFETLDIFYKNQRHRLHLCKNVLYIRSCTRARTHKHIL
jgi:hypothetical protein